MEPATIQFAISALCILYISTQLGLLTLNLRYVQDRSRMPEIFNEYFDAETWQRSRSYTLAKGKFEFITCLLNGAILLVLANSTLLGTVDDLIAGFQFPALIHSILYVLLITIGLTIIKIPLQIYRTFVIEARFGFNTTSIATWIFDLVKSFLLSGVLMVPMLAAFFWFVETAGANWWIFAWLFIALFQLGVFFLYPVLIAPLFNDFKPLSEGTLKDTLDQLAEKLQFKTAGVFVMDGSKRSKHGNAYFTGFGKNKRIVLFDTLVDTLPVAELAAVLAHEIGHEKLNHIKKSISLSMIILGVCLWVVAMLLTYPPLFEAFGFASPSAHAALMLFLLFSEPLLFFISPLPSMLSRLFEYQADRYAVEAVESPEPLQRALLMLSKKSLANIAPHPWFSFFHYSHPTLHERYIAMENYAADRF